MHDERKVKGEPDAKAKEQTRQLIAKFREVYDDVFKCKREGYKGEDVIKKIDALLELNPELYTVFNYRRQLLLHSWELAATASAEATDVTPADGEANGNGSAAGASSTSTVAGDGGKAKQLADMEREIKLNTKILLRDYKVYSAWLHRRWLFMRMGSQMKALFLSKERAQCEALLSVDERNFHAWGYRRWVLNEQRKLQVAAAEKKEREEKEEGGVSEADVDPNNAARIVADEHNTAERAFSLAKIERNISNFSAWHNRALIFVERLATIGLLPTEDLSVGVGRSGVAKTLSSTAAAEEVIGALVDDFMADVELAIKAFYNDPDDQSTWLYVERIIGLMHDASEKVQQSADKSIGDGAEGGEDSSTSTWAVRNDLLDASKGTHTLTVSADAGLLLAECVEACTTDLTECCTALRREALRNSNDSSNNDGAVTKGLKGMQWPTWLLLHLPTSPTGEERAQYWSELAVMDPQRRGYYTDMAEKEKKRDVKV